MGELLTEPHDGHGAGDTCPACPHAPAVPGPTVEARLPRLAGPERTAIADAIGQRTGPQYRAACDAVRRILAARAAAPDALRVRIEALADEMQRPLDGARQRANTGDDFAEIRQEEAVRGYWGDRLRGLLEDGAPAGNLS